jgi:hypothetical protein
MTGAYKASLINRRPRSRRTKAEIESIRREIYQILADEHPQTVRQVYYQLVSRGAIEKTDNEYNNTVVRLMTQMRRDRDLPFSWVADSTRVIRRPRTYSSLQSYFTRSAEMYRRALWDDIDVHVEIWVEKDTLTGVLYPITAAWDIPLMVARGFSSVTFLQSNGETIREYYRQGKQVYIYQFGDHDPSGVAAAQSVKDGLREFSDETPFTYERLAVTRDQIDSMRLPTRPTKKTDTRSKTFDGDSVEIEAIPAGVLREICFDAITQHVDMDRYNDLKATEEHEKELIKKWGAIHDRDHRV